MELRILPYKIQTSQSLSDINTQRGILRENLKHYITQGSTDEAQIHLNGVMYKHKFRFWAMGNPHQIQELPFHGERVTMRCALWSPGLNGPTFFKKPWKQNAPPTSWEMTPASLANTQRIAKEGVKSHIVRNVSNFPRETFQDQVISHTHLSAQVRTFMAILQAPI